MEKLLTREDLMELFQIGYATVVEWEGKGIVKRIQKLPGHPRYSPKQIAILMDMNLNEFSPFLLKKIERENKELAQENIRLKNQIQTIKKIIKGGN